MAVARHAQSSQNQLVIFLQYLDKKNNDEVYFSMQINMKVSYKLMLTFWVCLVRPIQSTHNIS